MFSQGLSLDQAPPFSVILRFFLTVPLFMFLISLAIFGADLHGLAYWDSPKMVAIVHLLLLGVVGMAMVGALFQMLPVLAGASMKEPLFHARWIHLVMFIGTLLLTMGFYFEKFELLHPALALLLGSLSFIVVLMLFKLLSIDNKTPSVIGMIISLNGLGFGLLFAVLVTLTFMGVDVGFLPSDLRTIHMHFMLFGWITVLIMAVAFQVIEMFYVTPSYPYIIRQWFPLILLTLLVVQFPFYIISESMVHIFDMLIGMVLFTFAAVTLRRLNQRKRPVADTTVWLWRTGLFTLIMAVVLVAATTVVDQPLLLDSAALLFGYFIISIVFAMSYKIVPFLVWFHLNAKGVLECPMMGDIIPSQYTQWHLWLHWLLLVSLFGALLFPLLWKVTALIFLMESLLYGRNLFGATKIYYTLKDKGVL